MLRHGIAALIVLALIAPLVPARDGGMPCCTGTGEACACPIGAGLSRCEAAPPLTPPERLPAVMPSTAALAPRLEASWIAPPYTESVIAFPLDLPDPVPRA